MLRTTRSLVQLSKLTASTRVLATRSLTTASRPKTAQPIGKVLAWTALGACASTVTYMTLKSPVYAEAPIYAGTIEEPSTKLVFPIFLNTNNDWKRLIGLGPRTVTFININVYVLGLYMRSEDIGELKKLEGWKNFDKSKFLEDDTLAEELLDQPYDISIRLVPARSTNTQHLRDGFLRLFMSRLKDQSLTEDEERDIMGAIQEFKKNFINMKVKKDTEFIFTKTKDGSFNMSYEGKDLGTIKNKWLGKNFVMGYLNVKQPSSEAALLDIADGFEVLMRPEVVNKEK